MDTPERQAKVFGYVTDVADRFDAEMERRARDPERSVEDRLIDEILKRGAQMILDDIAGMIRAAYPAA